MDYIYIKNKEGYGEYPAGKTAVVDGTEVMLSAQPAYDYGTLEDGRRFLYIKGEAIRFLRNNITMVSQEAGDIKIAHFPAKMFLEGDRLTIEPVPEEDKPEVYCNGVRLLFSDGRIRRDIRPGDVYLINETKWVLSGEEIAVNMKPGTFESGLLRRPNRQQPFEHFPEYRRSPRMIKRLPDETVVLSKPPEKSEMGRGSLVQLILPPLGMLCVTVAVSLMMKRGIFVLMSVATTLMTTIFSITRFFKEKKECRLNNETRERVYDEYLLRKREEIYGLWLEEKDALAYNYPPLSRIARMIDGYSERIYERSSNDGDFMTISVGTAREPVNYHIQLDNQELTLKTDELVEEAQGLKKEFSYIDHKPVVIDLKEAHLGLVGDKGNIHEQLKILVLQMAFMYSYHDLQFIALYDEEYIEDLRWMNWLPHFRIRAVNTYGGVHSERVRDQVMGSLNQILKERKIKKEESKKESRFRPHYVFIIDEPKLVMDHSIMEYLGKGGDDLGFSIIYTSHLRANLPENIRTLLLLDHSEQGRLLLNNGIMTDKRIALDRAGDIEAERLARNLSVLKHELGVVTRIPESITFFEMYKIEHPWQLDIVSRWSQSNSHKSLAVPLGVRAADDYVYLNLHEKAHGPHGLVAGTTGSGKSEIVQSYILSLAVNFNPYEVGFLLIDYKGGGMAGLFKNLPHLLGVITNLDGSESMRAMASIKSELARRQRIFNEYEVNHINGYNQLFKNGTAKEPMPHLFLISDEFAELKKEQPDFMTELVSAARIGRSLGVHLILATQKPTGVVDDQIWTNSKFKLALKVQNEADSREIIKTGDAANITQPGRAYLQVGNNEIYELFQSAWSGASYIEEKQEEQADNRVYLINELGQGELINQDLSGTGESNQLKKTQLDAVADHIREVYESMGAIPVKRPWLPSLKTQIALPCLENVKRQEGMDLTLVLGMMDIPEEQRQSEYVIDLQKEGNILYVASGGFGKSVFLETAVLSLAAQNAVGLLNFYILDFGNSALISLRGLPHTCDYMTLDSEELMQKFEELIQGEIARRKKLLASRMVQNFQVYNQVSEDRLKAIVIVVDNFDAVKDLGMEEEGFYAALSRDGAGLGIYLVIAASRTGAVKMATMNNFKNRIVGYTFDNSEALAMVGRTSYKPSEIKGRVLVKSDGCVSAAQLYCPVSFIDDVEYTKKLKDKIGEIKNLYPGEQAPRIPVLPETFTLGMMDDYEKTPADIYLGLHKKTVKLHGFRNAMAPFVIAGDTAKGKTNALFIILSQLRPNRPAYLFDSKAMELYSFKDAGGILYIDTLELLEQWIGEMGQIIEERRAGFITAMEAAPGTMPRDVYQQMEPVYCIIDDIDDFAEFTKPKSAETARVIREAAAAGVTVIITAHTAKMKGIDDVIKFTKNATDGLVLSNQGMGAIFPLGISSRDQPQFMDGCLFHNGTYERLRIPKYQ